MHASTTILTIPLFSPERRRRKEKGNEGRNKIHKMWKKHEIFTHPLLSFLFFFFWHVVKQECKTGKDAKVSRDIEIGRGCLSARTYA